MCVCVIKFLNFETLYDARAQPEPEFSVGLEFWEPSYGPSPARKSLVGEEMENVVKSGRKRGRVAARWEQDGRGNKEPRRSIAKLKLIKIQTPPLGWTAPSRFHFTQHWFLGTRANLKSTIIPSFPQWLKREYPK